MSVTDGRADVRPCKLYRLFDAEWRLLYIGISLTAAERFAQHADSKSWWPEVQHITMREFPTRAEALTAERDAIKADRPKYNVTHNGPPAAVRVVRERPPSIPELPPAPDPRRWRFQTRHGYERTCQLSLLYQVNGTSISDNYDYADASAADLFEIWQRDDRYTRDGWADIYWSVRSTPDGVFETAPFQEDWTRNHFLKFFTWPVDADTGERLNWWRLPVDDGTWCQRSITKGGFFQEHTGWKPAPLQARVHVDTLLMGAGLLGDAIGWRRGHWPKDPGPHPAMQRLEAEIESGDGDA